MQVSGHNHMDPTLKWNIIILSSWSSHTIQISQTSIIDFPANTKEKTTHKTFISRMRISSLRIPFSTEFSFLNGRRVCSNSQQDVNNVKNLNFPRWHQQRTKKILFIMNSNVCFSHLHAFSISPQFHSLGTLAWAALKPIVTYGSVLSTSLNTKRIEQTWRYLLDVIASFFERQIYWF